MSRTTTIGYDDRWFWVFDEARAIWLKFLIEAVERRAASNEPTVMAANLHDWRVKSTVGDLGLELGPWSGPEQAAFLDLNGEACDALVGAQPLAIDEVSTWTLLDDTPLVQRLALWDDPIDVRPIVELGEAVAELVAGTLEDPPPGTRWFFGTRDGRRTIAMRSRRSVISRTAVRTCTH